MSEQLFQARWSTKLKWTTAIVFCLILGIALTSKREPTLLVIAIVAIGALLAIRGYRVEDGVLVIRRLVWNTKIDLKKLENAVPDSSAMDASLRVFGIGGLFAYVGRFRNSRLGTYSAFVTEPLNAVVLRFPDRCIVVSPTNPELFAKTVRASAQSAAAS